MRIIQLPLCRRQVYPICPCYGRYRGLRSAIVCSLKCLLQNECVFERFLPFVRKPRGGMLSKYFKNEQMREMVHEVSFPVIADFPACHLESHINHLLFETDMNQREHTSHGQRPADRALT